MPKWKRGSNRYKKTLNPKGVAQEKRSKDKRKALNSLHVSAAPSIMLHKKETDRLSLEDYGQREAVKAKDALRPEVLAELSESYYKNTRKLVAKNKRTDLATQMKLANDPETEVRCALGEYTKNSSVLKELTKDSSWMVRFSVCRNYDASPRILESLVDDENDLVKEGAKMRLSQNLNHQEIDLT